MSHYCETHGVNLVQNERCMLCENGVATEHNMSDVSELAGFSSDIKAIEQSMLNTQQLLRDAMFELEARQRLIQCYREKNYAHEDMVGKLYELLKAEDLDGAMDIVRREYEGIHGPND